MPRLGTGVLGALLGREPRLIRVGPALTVRHRRRHELGELMDALSDGFRRLLSGRAWQRERLPLAWWGRSEAQRPCMAGRTAGISTSMSSCSFRDA
jgi:hypothetical protein